MAAVSTISAMKVERPRAKIIRRADAREQSIGKACMKALRGHEAAGLRQHDEERVLAQEGRFTGHVRAGDE